MHAGRAIKAHGAIVVAQRGPGMAGRHLAHLLRRALRHDAATTLAAFRPQVNQPVAGADHVQVVLDHHQRMAGLQQLAEGLHQPRNVVEMQAGGRLVKQEQRTFRRQPLSALAGAFCRFGQESSQLQALRLAAAQRRYRLAQAHIVQAHIHDRLERAQHLAIRRMRRATRGGIGRAGAKQQHRLVHRQLQHIGHVQRAATTLYRHFQDFRAVALAVAVRAAQVDIAQELHLHMLETAAATGRATAIATVEAELARGITALLRQRRGGKQLADRIPGADIAHRVGTRRLADRRLVHEHHVGQMVRAQQTIMLARRLGGLAKLAQQRRCQHVLDQRGLARSAHAGDADHALQRNLQRHVLQVVGAHAFQDQARRVVLHRTQLPAGRIDHLAPAAQVVTGERGGLAQVLRRAVKHDLAAALARPRAHVDDAVGRPHHRRVMLHHHQRVASIAQAQHRLGDAVHVARVQADAGLVQHEQGVDQRGAQRRRQVDALHLAATQGAALPVQRQVADADIAQIAQPVADFLEQQLLRLHVGGIASLLRAGFGQQGKELPQPLDRQLHQVVQAQAGQGFQLRTRPVGATRHEALFWRQHGIGLRLVAHTPEQAFRLQARTGTRRTLGVAAVLGQQHPDMHLVGLGFQVVKKALDAVPLLVPATLVVGRTVNHPALLCLGQLVPGGVTRNAGFFGMAHQIVLRLDPGRRLDRLDRALAQRQLLVRNHQAPVHANHAAKAAAGLAGAYRRVEREHGWQRRAVGDAAFRAQQAAGVFPQRRLTLAFRRQHIDAHPAFTMAQRAFQCLDHAAALDLAHAEAVCHHVQDLAVAALLTLLHPGIARCRQPLLDFFLGRVVRQLHRKGQHQTRITGLGSALLQVGEDGIRMVLAHRQGGDAVMQMAKAGKEQLQVVVQLGHGAHGGAAGTHRVGLVDRNRRRHALHPVHRRLVHAVQELARIGAEGFHVTALALSVQGIEHQAGLAGTTGPGHHRQLAGADVQIQVAQVVLARAPDADAFAQIAASGLAGDRLGHGGGGDGFRHVDSSWEGSQ